MNTSLSAVKAIVCSHYYRPFCVTCPWRLTWPSTQYLQFDQFESPIDSSEQVTHIFKCYFTTAPVKLLQLVWPGPALACLPVSAVNARAVTPRCVTLAARKCFERSRLENSLFVVKSGCAFGDVCAAQSHSAPLSPVSLLRQRLIDGDSPCDCPPLVAQVTGAWIDQGILTWCLYSPLCR